MKTLCEADRAGIDASPALSRRRVHYAEQIVSGRAPIAVLSAAGTTPFLPFRAVSRLRSFRRATTRSFARSQEVRS